MKTTNARKCPRPGARRPGGATYLGGPIPTSTFEPTWGDNRAAPRPRRPLMQHYNEAVARRAMSQDPRVGARGPADLYGA